MPRKRLRPHTYQYKFLSCGQRLLPFLSVVGLSSAALCGSTGSSRADSLTYVGMDGGSFNVAANWTNNTNPAMPRVPGAGDTATWNTVRVLLNGVSAFPTTTNVNNGGTMDLANGQTYAGTVLFGNTGGNVAAGNLYLEGAASATSYTFGSNLTLTGRLASIGIGNSSGSNLATLTTAATINANVASNTTTLGLGNAFGSISSISNSGAITASNGNNLVLASAFTNTGTVSALSSSSLTFNSGFTNNNGGTVQQQGTGTLNLGSGFVTNNAGATFSVADSATTKLSNATFTNTGTASLGILTGSGTLSSTLPTNTISTSSVALANETLKLNNATLNVTSNALALNDGATLDVRGSTMLNSSTARTLDAATLTFGNSTGNTSAGRLLFEGATSSSPTYVLGSGLTLTGRIGSIGTTALTINGAVTLNTAAQIFANVVGNTTTIGVSGLQNVNAVTNTGTISATNGNALALNSRTFTNSGSLIVGTGTGATVGGSTFSQSGSTANTRIDGTLTLNGANPFTVGGGTVQGTGTITGDLNNTGGILSPGDSPGKLTLTGNYTQGSAASMFLEIGGNSQGQTYDLFAISGAASLDGTLNISLASGYRPVVGQTFDFLTYGSHVGTFASVLSGDGGVSYTINYGATGATLRVAAVPEPGLFVSLSGGFVLLGVLRKRQRLSVER